MLLSRRGFLIGAGSLLTAAFVKDARSFIRTTGRPLLAPPKQALQTLYWYGDYDGGDDGYTLKRARPIGVPFKRCAAKGRDTGWDAGTYTNGRDARFAAPAGE